MYQLLVKTSLNNNTYVTPCGTHITIIELVKQYNSAVKIFKNNIANIVILGYLIINLETDEIVERFYEV